jgi:hypothetical protein
MGALGVSANPTGHRISWRGSLDLDYLGSWLLLRITWGSIVLHGMVRLSHHLGRQLCTTLGLFLRESNSITWLVLELGWSRLCLLLVPNTSLVVIGILVCLRAWYHSVPCATHGSLVDHQLDVRPLRVKSSTHIWLCWVVVRPVIVLGEELAHILGWWRTGKEGLREVLGNLASVIQKFMVHDLVKIWSFGRISIENSLD